MSKLLMDSFSIWFSSYSYPSHSLEHYEQAANFHAPPLMNGFLSSFLLNIQTAKLLF